MLLGPTAICLHSKQRSGTEGDRDMSEWDQYWIMADAKRAARPAPAPRPRWARVLHMITGFAF